MGCGGSSAKGPPPAGPCKLTPQQVSTFVDKGYWLRNDKKEKVMLLGRGTVKEQKEDWQQALAYEAKSMIDNSTLMYIASETTCFNFGNLENFANWGDDLTKGWKDADAEKKYVEVADPMGVVTRFVHFQWQVELKSIIFSDATKSKELASITVKGQGESWSAAGEDSWNTHFTKGLKYALVVDGADVPLELEGISPCGLKWKAPMFTVEWTAKEFSTSFAYQRTGYKETKLVTTEKDGNEALLGTVLGGLIATELNPFNIGINKIEDRFNYCKDNRGRYLDVNHSI